MCSQENLLDEELVVACQKELPYVITSFEALVRMYEARVFQACRQYLGHPEEDEEACQNVFLKVFQGLPKFRREASFKTWLYQNIRNVCFIS